MDAESSSLAETQVSLTETKFSKKKNSKKRKSKAHFWSHCDKYKLHLKLLYPLQWKSRHYSMKFSSHS